MNVARHNSSEQGNTTPNPHVFKRADDGLPSPCHEDGTCRPNAVIDCGWGRLLYGPSFDSPRTLAEALQEEEPGKRDIALHVESPQLVLAEAPSHLFLDPSLIFRRRLGDEPEDASAPGIAVRPLTTRADIAAINRLYSMRRMVPVDPQTVWLQRNNKAIQYVVAEDDRTGEIVGSALGIDHYEAFGDEQGGCSLWCLAVDPQTGLFGAGRAMVNYLIAHFTSRGRRFLDLSVLHDNETAIGLYRKLGFEEVPGFVVKNKNAINEKLFVETTDFG